MSGFRTLALSLVAATAITAPAHAAEKRPFDRAIFLAAQRTGRPILVDVRADWCPTCASQGATIGKTVSAQTFNRLLILEVDYDTQKDVWHSFGAQKQGTLIGYHGMQEVGRLQFVTDPGQIKALLARTLR